MFVLCKEDVIALIVRGARSVGVGAMFVVVVSRISPRLRSDGFRWSPEIAALMIEIASAV